jgi:tetratricopeptide (TPR) repeat protein
VWEQVLRKDSDNVIARVELATCLNALGDTREALRIVDSLRAEKRSNAEVLFKAAELNQTLGNFTAARDNIALIVSNFPSKRALERARDLSEQMNRIEDALEYHEEIERASYTDADSQRTKTRLLLALLLKQSPTDAALLEGLSGFVKRHPGCVEALERLGALEIKAGRFEAAAELLVKAAKASGDDPEKWFQVVDLWISKAPGDFAKRAERALAAGRSAARAGSGVARLKAELLLCRTLIALHRHEEALTAVESLPALAEREGAPMPDELKEAAITLKGLCLARLGRLHETNSLWQDLAASRGPTLEERSSKRSHPHKVEPSPTLSTP